MNNPKYQVSPGLYPNKTNSKSTILKQGDNIWGSYGFSQQARNKAKKGGCACGGAKVVKRK
ncbi:hypothetical protein ABEV55_03870 [Aneurinibacillus thermoaerophilus]|uniref:hypothetical protein n=1 Tax=Aneurinibacillus thermoaerophilus TaxID=143495 RepID=UPI002E1DB7E8|nr:hypothetical protein [Aneurinibacillus thermoaerophilus]